VYNDAHPFSEGLAKVRLGAKFGFIDRTGKVVIDTIYDSASHFRNGAAQVTLQGQTFRIDAHGFRLPG
jgi:WG containing repeat